MASEMYDRLLRGEISSAAYVEDLRRRLGGFSDFADVYVETLRQNDRYREALLRVCRDRREADKVFAQCSSALGMQALEDAGLMGRSQPKCQTCRDRRTVQHTETWGDGEMGGGTITRRPCPACAAPQGSGG